MHFTYFHKITIFNTCNHAETVEAAKKKKKWRLIFFEVVIVDFNEAESCGLGKNVNQESINERNTPCLNLKHLRILSLCF